MANQIALPQVDPPFARDAIVIALEALHSDSVRYWDALPAEEFFASLGSGWSPADNVRHLTKSIRAVTRGLTMPRLVLWALFGRSGTPSRTYVEIRGAYHEVLRAGAKAGRFAPSSESGGVDRAERRRMIMAYHAQAVKALVGAARRWSEATLDRYRLPHPLLGKLTLREMLLFTLYHNLHHVHVVARRRGETDEGETALR